MHRLNDTHWLSNPYLSYINKDGNSNIHLMFTRSYMYDEREFNELNHKLSNYIDEIKINYA